jgi:adenosylhomocysteine nucleosidase
MIINGVSVLTLIAAQSEYGTKMTAAGIQPEFIGVGPIEASFNTSKTLMQKQFDNKLPDIIFSVGTAGSATLNQAELYQITSASYRDMNAIAFGFPKGVTPFADYPAIFELPALFKDMPTASIATGACVINKQGCAGITFADIDADCVDMETYAVMRVAHGFKIPVIGLRGISDGKYDSHGIASWEEYLSVIDTKIANFYDRLHNESTCLMRVIAEAKSLLDKEF